MCIRLNNISQQVYYPSDHSGADNYAGLCPAYEQDGEVACGPSFFRVIPSRSGIGGYRGRYLVSTDGSKQKGGYTLVGWGIASEYLDPKDFSFLTLYMYNYSVSTPTKILAGSRIVLTGFKL